MGPAVIVSSAVRRRVSPAVTRALRRRLRRAAARLGVRRTDLATLCVKLLGDAEMEALHDRYMGEPGATDVLSFPGEDGAVGDIAIAWDVAARQAAGDILEEVVQLALHGLVHLLGHDHGTRRGARAMLRLERRACRAAQSPPPVRPYGEGAS